MEEAGAPERGEADRADDARADDADEPDPLDAARWSPDRGWEDPDGRDDPVAPDPTRFNSWRQRSAAGVVISGMTAGLIEALERPREEPAIVVQADGEPPGPRGLVDLHLDPDDPRKTVAVVRQPADKARAGHHRTQPRPRQPPPPSA